jgi:hypothetical protein
MVVDEGHMLKNMSAQRYGHLMAFQVRVREIYRMPLVVNIEYCTAIFKTLYRIYLLFE